VTLKVTAADEWGRAPVYAVPTHASTDPYDVPPLPGCLTGRSTGPRETAAAQLSPRNGSRVVSPRAGQSLRFPGAGA
jgi:hypothetical protein